MIAMALNSKDAWEEHKKAYSFAEAQRPPWVGVGKEAAIALEAAQVLKEAKGVRKASQVGQVGADAPGSRVGTPIQGSGQTVGAPGASAPTPGASSPTPGTPLSADERALAQVNAELNKVSDGYHVETIGGNALRAWVKSNNILEMNGGYWQNRQLPTRELVLVKRAGTTIRLCRSSATATCPCSWRGSGSSLATQAR